MSASRLKTIKFLAGTMLILALLILYFQLLTPQKFQERSYGKKLINNLKKDNITMITISDKKDSFSLEKKEGAWFIKAKGKYLPCKSDKISIYLDLLEKLPAGIIIDKGDNTTNDAKYGFDQDQYQKVDIKTSNKTDFYMIVGSSGPSAGTSYIRLRDENKVREVKSTISTETGSTISSWGNKKIFSDDIKKEDIEKIEIESFNFKWFKGKYTLQSVAAKTDSKDSKAPKSVNFELIPSPNGKVNSNELLNMVNIILALNAYDFKTEGELGTREKLGQVKLYMKNNANFTLSFYAKDPADIGDYIMTADFNNYLYIFVEDYIKNFFKNPNDLIVKEEKK